MDSFAPFPATVATDHRPLRRGTDLVGLRGLLAGALGRCGVKQATTAPSSVEALVYFDFGSGEPSGTVSPVNAELATAVPVGSDVAVLAQRETSRVLADAGHQVIDVETVPIGHGRRRDHGHFDTADVVDVVANLADRAGWTSVGVVAHPAHIARCVATCQRAGLHVAAFPMEAAERGWYRGSTQWWTRSRTRWMARELAVVAHHMVTGRVLLRF